jgi:hypothetical protein
LFSLPLVYFKAQKRRGGAQSKTWRSLIAAGLALLAASAHAQNYTIGSSTIDSGGGTSTGAVCSVSGTIGQPDAGRARRQR